MHGSDPRSLFPAAQTRKTETLKASAVGSQSRSLNLWLLVKLAGWGSRACLGVQPGARNSSLPPPLLPEGSPCSARGQRLCCQRWSISLDPHSAATLSPPPWTVLPFLFFTRGISLSSTLIDVMFYAGCLSPCLSSPHSACPPPYLFQEPLSRLQTRVSAAQSMLCTQQDSEIYLSKE